MSVSTGSQNPYEPPQATIEKVAAPTIPVGEVPIWNVNWDRLLLGISVAICSVAVPLAFRDIESIVFSGVAISAAGLCLTCREIACRRRKRPAWTLNLILGCAGPLISMTLTSVIAIRKWSPADAQRNHVDWIVVVFAVCFTVLAIVGFLTFPKDQRR